MLFVDDLHVFYDAVEAVAGVGFHVTRGELVTIIGPNGAGKSTLLSAIAGLLPVSRGRITFEGVELTPGRSDRTVRRGLVMAAEEREVFAPLSVEENLLLGAYVVGGHGKKVHAELERIYCLFPMLKQKRHTAAGSLSGGQQQMLVIGRALMSEPKLLLLDEPSLGLAPLVVREIFETIANLRSAGLTVVLVEQNAHLALSVADRGYVMEDGRISLEGTSQELGSDVRIRQVYLGMDSHHAAL